MANDFIQSRDHGMQNIEALAAEWSQRMALSEQTIRLYLSSNIHYVLDEECLEGIRVFFHEAAETGVLPPYDFDLVGQVGREPASK